MKLVSSYVKKKSIKNIADWVITIGVAVILAIIINKFIIFKVIIPSESMVPTLNINDQLFVTRVYDMDKLKHGDLVVFYSDEDDILMIKRLIGLPGDEVTISNGVVALNGETLIEDYLGVQDDFSGKYKVPEGEFFFLGDNRGHSEDSRMWNYPYVSAKNIKGKARVKVYPFRDFGVVI